MRKITRLAAEALLNGESLSLQNTVVKDAVMYLHLNPIACVTGNNHRKLGITASGWPTVTTKDRLNGVLSIFTSGKYFVRQEKGDWFLYETNGNTCRKVTLMDSQEWYYINL